MTTAHPTLHLTLLRYSRSRADDANVHEGRYDRPLNAVGEQQARLLAEYWIRHPPGFEAILCSTLRRARGTAEIVGAALGLTPQPSHLWREWDNGPLAELGRDEALRRYPIPAFRHDFEPFTAEGGESQAQIRVRALTALHDLWALPFTSVLGVSHGGFSNLGFSNSLLRELTGATRGGFEFGDTAFTTPRLRRNTHTAVVTGVNLQPHLRDGTR